MRVKLFPAVLSLCLLLTGCSWTVSPYVSITPHREQRQTGQTDVLMAENYLDLLEALRSIIADGTELSAIIVANYPEDGLTHGMDRAVQYVLKNDPLGAYAVETILYELGTSSGMPAVSVSIDYRRSRSEIQQIRTVENMDAVQAATASALEGYDSSLVLLVNEYSERDLSQFVQDYALEHPEIVMETPQVSEGIYGTGISRVVELIFTYQTSRESLRRMQQEVQPVFEAAALYVSGDDKDYQKLSQLYAFLMKRFDYKVETSITPAYSLLRHGVGDSRAFATVYAAMCRSAGLECMTVSGTRSGEPWTWNIVRDDGFYYHVDLLRSSEYGRFREHSDLGMENYVWDYSSYPACEKVPLERGDPAASEETTEPTVPDETAESTVPDETTEPTVPDASTEPTSPEETTAPTAPEETTEPTGPEKPTAPTAPTPTTTPTTPTTPALPGVPEPTTGSEARGAGEKS